MKGFIFGVAVTIAVRLVGWDTIGAVLGAADGVARDAAAEVETQAAHVRAELARRERARGAE